MVIQRNDNGEQGMPRDLRHAEADIYDPGPGRCASSQRFSLGNYYPGYGQEAYLGLGRFSHAGRGPKGFKRSDEAIQDDVVAKLTASGAIDARDMEVKVERGYVTLEGSVPTRFQKHLAEDLVCCVPGVKDVQSALQVANPVGHGIYR